jgi:hypothetical protein
MLIVHNITGCETESRGHLLPGYAALKLAPPRRWRWHWWHPTAVLTMAAAALLVAANHGLLP